MFKFIKNYRELKMLIEHLKKENENLFKRLESKSDKNGYFRKKFEDIRENDELLKKENKKLKEENETLLKEKRYLNNKLLDLKIEEQESKQNTEG